jgi:DNA polymerase-3 subunit delta'
MIIWLPEKFNATSANRLLKLIEEPPSNTLFLLVSENAGQILKTIYSRTQLIKIPPIEEKAIFEALINSSGSSERNARTAARSAQGDYIRALQILSDKDNKNDHFNAFVMLMRYAYMNDIIALTEWAEDMASRGREQQKSFLIYAENLIRETFMLNIKIDDIVYLGFDEYEWAQKFAPFINKKNVGYMHNCFNSCIWHIGQNGNAKIIFTDLALKTSRLIRK